MNEPIMEINISGFNSIKHVDLPLNEGVTIVTGPSNVGKSSIIKAIYQLIYNPSGTKYINTEIGKTKISMRVGTDEYTFTRGTKGSTNYKVNDKVYEKVNGQLLELESLIPKGNEVNFWLQNSNMYLIGESPKTRYDLLFSGVDYETTRNLIMDDQKKVKQSLRDLEVQIDLRKADEFKISSILLSEEKHQALETCIQEVETSQKTFNSLYQQLSGLNTLNKSIQALQERINALNGLTNSFNTLDTIESEINHIKVLEGALSNLNVLYSSLKTTKEQITNLESELNTHKSELATFKLCPLCGGEIHE